MPAVAFQSASVVRQESEEVGSRVVLLSVAPVRAVDNHDYPFLSPSPGHQPRLSSLRAERGERSFDVYPTSKHSEPLASSASRVPSDWRSWGSAETDGYSTKTNKSG